MNKSTFSDAILLIVAFIIAFVALNLFARGDVDLVNLAKGNENTSREEFFKGDQFTACDISAMKTIVNNRSSQQGFPSSCRKFKRVLWLGNSQLHYINQYKEGDHLSPYWLRVQWGFPDCFEPLGFSLPNANLQEFFVLSQFVVMDMPINVLIMELCFDKLRDTGLRDEFSKILSPELMESIRKKSEIGAAIINKFTSTHKDSNNNEGILAGTSQKHMELWLTNQMNKHWPLWAKRSQIEGQFMVGLYYFRNWALGIRPTSERKMIAARYDLNMRALAGILADYRQRGIPVLLYIAPIRQDYPIPYDLHEYSRWKSEVEDMAQKFGATALNLEKLVPGDLWGSYHKEDLDFMHFQGPGHRIVADAILPYTKKLIKVTGLAHVF